MNFKYNNLGRDNMVLYWINEKWSHLETDLKIIG